MLHVNVTLYVLHMSNGKLIEFTSYLESNTV